MRVPVLGGEHVPARAVVRHGTAGWARQLRATARSVKSTEALDRRGACGLARDMSRAPPDPAVPRRGLPVRDYLRRPAQDAFQRRGECWAIVDADDPRQRRARDLPGAQILADVAGGCGDGIGSAASAG